MLEAIEFFLGFEAKQAATKQETEQKARREARRAAESRLNEDPELNAKAVVLSKAFALAVHEVMGKSETGPEVQKQ